MIWTAVALCLPGNCSIVAVSSPSRTFPNASGSASKPMIAIPFRLRALIASSAPSAMSIASRGIWATSVALCGFDRHRRRLAAAYAERRDAALEAAGAQRPDQRHKDARARSADRMAERAGAAVDVDLVARQRKIAHRCHRDDCEGFVDLEEIDGIFAPSG